MHKERTVDGNSLPRSIIRQTLNPVLLWLVVVIQDAIPRYCHIINLLFRLNNSRANMRARFEPDFCIVVHEEDHLLAPVVGKSRSEDVASIRTELKGASAYVRRGEDGRR